MPCQLICKGFLEMDLCQLRSFWSGMRFGCNWPKYPCNGWMKFAQRDGSILKWNCHSDNHVWIFSRHTLFWTEEESFHPKEGEPIASMWRYFYHLISVLVYAIVLCTGVSTQIWWQQHVGTHGLFAQKSRPTSDQRCRNGQICGTGYNR